MLDLEGTIKARAEPTASRGPHSATRDALTRAGHAQAARRKCGEQLIVVCDNTFATPLNTQAPRVYDPGRVRAHAS